MRISFKASQYDRFEVSVLNGDSLKHSVMSAVWVTEITRCWEMGCSEESQHVQYSWEIGAN